MKLSRGLFFLLDGDVEITEGIIEIMKLITQKASEEVETGLLLSLTAALDGNI